MTNKQPVILVPFDAIPHRVLFRYDRKWWKRRSGTLNAALSLDGENLVINEKSVVVMLKKDLNPKMHYEILQEFSSTIRWPRLK